MKRMLIILTILTVGLALSACHRNDTPEGVMDTATMADFMTDALLLDGYGRLVVSQHPDSLSYQLDEAYNALYTQYHITPAIYDSSMAYYVRHPQLYEAVMERVKMRLYAMNL